MSTAAGAGGGEGRGWQWIRHLGTEPREWNGVLWSDGHLKLISDSM